MVGISLLAGGLVLCTGSGPAAAGSGPGTAPASRISDIQYEVRFDATTAQRRSLLVTMRFRASEAGAVRLSLPAWTPGAYEISNFARKVSDFAVTAGGRSLRWDKADYDTWRVEAEGPSEIVVQFAFLADTLDNAMAWARPDFAFFNGTNVFLFPEEVGLDFPSRVTIRTEDDWMVATGMTPAGARRQYTASSFHELVDMPVFVGRLDLDSMRIDNRWYRVASYPERALAGGVRETFWDWTRKIIPPMTAVFGEVPWETYTTLLVFHEGFRGGSALEHANSHMGIYNPRFIGNPILASITAHEMFHAWNVKRLRPAPLVPYDYSRPQPTTLLWVSEGITDYYADLALVRGGIIPPALFYQITSGKVETVAGAPPVALEDASLSTWIQPTDGTQFIYYPKGSLAGLLLDVLIRDASNNRTSLDDVLRQLYRTTSQNGQGFTEEQWWQAARQAAGGRSFEEFHRNYIDGRDPFPYGRILPLAGLALAADTTRVPRLGVSTGADSVGVRVVAVTPGSSAAEAGLRLDDVLLRVGEVEVRGADFGAEFRRRYARRPEGSALPITVRRDGAAQTLGARLGFAEEVSYAVEEDPRATTKARRIRDGILRGVLDR